MRREVRRRWHPFLVRAWLVWIALVSGCSEPPVAAEEPVVPPVASEAAPPPTPGAAFESVVTIAASGDLVLNPHAMRAIEDDGEDGYDNLLAGYAAALEEEEIAFLNLEQPLVDDRMPLDPGWPRQDTSRPRRSPVLGATPPLADALARAGVDIVSVTNNHAYDQGRRGLSRTLEELRRVHVEPVGAGATVEDAYGPVPTSGRWSFRSCSTESVRAETSKRRHTRSRRRV